MHPKLSNITMNEKDMISKGKFLSLILRHNPSKIGLTLDENGWASVDILLIQLAKHHHKLTMEQLELIVETNNKKRYSFNEDKTKIRANQGHSLKDIDLGLEARIPPKILYHGTASRFLKAIMQEGINKGSRQHVHLSIDLVTAKNVGSRHGLPVILEIDAEKMQAEGFKFYCSDNGVWLTDHIPAQYLTQLD